jgi:exodeoxyribonuclease V alpha subunit
MWEYLETLRQWEQLSDLDLHFGRFLARLASCETPELVMAACLVSHWTSNGHVCLDLNELAGKPLFAQVGTPWPAPPREAWTTALLASPVVGRPGDFCPLVLDAHGRLYLQRYWHYEQQLAADLRQRMANNPADLDVARLRDGLARLFPEPPGPDCNWQKIATATAVLKRCCVIAGGPGTGKTSTVARVLALLVEQAGVPKLRIGLAAPTGKAAGRLQEAVRRARQHLPLDPATCGAIPDETFTLHRLLGAHPDALTFRYHRDNPLPLDVLVIDEASMIDLGLMAKLVQALPPQARLILLGDRDQLASVEAGAVLGDICWAAPALSAPFCADLERLTGEHVPTSAARLSAIGDAVIVLQQSYRFGSRSGIGQLARAVHNNDTTQAMHLLQGEHFDDLAWRPLRAPMTLHQHLTASIHVGFRPYLDLVKAGAAPADVFAALDRFRVLCAHRSGPVGAAALNQQIEDLLQAARLIDARHPWYPGRPVMITRNDYALRLFNGDVGITLPDPEASGRLRVYFPAPDDSMRRLSPLRLPAHETVYAMTVHKSQGSEFDDVLFVLGDEHSAVLTRELLYTGITRARLRTAICGTEAVLRAAIGRRLQRSSGLREALWGCGNLPIVTPGASAPDQRRTPPCHTGGGNGGAQH